MIETVSNSVISLLLGGIIGYWIKSKIDIKAKRQVRAEQYDFDDLGTQRDLLQEFLGDPMSSLNLMLHHGIHWDADRRQKKAEIIGKWVDKHRAKFPGHIRTKLRWLRNTAAGMIADEGMMHELKEEIIDARISEAEETIRSYIDEIDQKLRNK